MYAHRGSGGHAFWFLGAIFAIIGIIAAATGANIGLGMVAWFLLAIFTMVASIPFYLGLALGWLLREKK
ncbi:hypothetical protein ACFLYC_01665 [Chloroflexota bacterium]